MRLKKLKILRDIEKAFPATQQRTGSENMMEPLMHAWHATRFRRYPNLNYLMVSINPRRKTIPAIGLDGLTTYHMRCQECQGWF